MSQSFLKVENGRDLGPQFVDNPRRMVGQDGAYSIALEKDSFWFFGDTLIGSRVPGESIWYPGGVPVGPWDLSGKGTIEYMPNTTGLILKDKTGAGGLKKFEYVCDDEGNIRQLIPRLPDEHPDEVRVWCLHGCYLYKKLYLYYITVQMLKEGPFPVNFTLRGSGLAVGDTKNWDFHRLEYQGNTLWWNHQQPQFASTVLNDPRSEWLYLYGVIQDETGMQQCYNARVSPEDIEHPDKYEYLVSTEPKWSKDIGKAIALMEGMPNEMSVSYNSHLGCYLAVHSYQISGRIVGRTAPKPWGPWSDPTTLWTVKVEREKPLPYPIQVYAAKEHPEIAGENGRILYITYIEFEEYFPHLIEVTLAS